MIDSVIGNIIATAICTVIFSLIKKLYNRIKFQNKDGGSASELKHTKEFLSKQFWLWLFLLFLSVIAIFTVDMSVSSVFLCVVKLCAFIVASFSFIFLWGTFDAALAFVPSANVVKMPAERTTDNAIKKNR